MLFPEMISWSKPPKKNALFLTIGPPTVKPPNSSFSRGFLVKQVLLGGVPQICWFLLAKMLPCQAFVPDLVMILTTEPELRPYSGPNWLVINTYCPTNSAFVA